MNLTSDYSRVAANETTGAISWWENFGWKKAHLGDRPPIQGYIHTSKVSLEPSPWHPHMKRAVRMLLKQFPHLADRPIDFDGYSPGTVSEYLKTGELHGPKNRLPKFLFHGTSIYRWENIKEDGLRPRAETGADPVYGTMYNAPLGPAEHIYLSGNPTAATRFAANEAGRDGSFPVILKIATGDFDYDRLRPDHDSGEDTWDKSLQQTNTVAYEGVIDSQAIELYKAWSPETKKWEDPGDWLEPQDWLAQQFLHRHEGMESIPGTTGKYKWVKP